MLTPRDVLKKIKEEKIKPDPKWKSLAKNYGYWLILFLMVLFGATMFSILLVDFFDFHSWMGKELKIFKYFRILIMTMPLVWLILCLVALFFGILAFHRTKHGYRYRNLFVLAIVVLIISFLASLAHFTNFSRKIEKTFDRNIPRRMQGMIPPKEGRMFLPEEGFIVGRVSQLGNQYFFILNYRDEEWKVLVSKETQFFDIPLIKLGLRVFVAGEKIEEKIFEAKEVKSFEPPGRGIKEKKYRSEF